MSKKIAPTKDAEYHLDLVVVACNRIEEYVDSITYE